MTPSCLFEKINQSKNDFEADVNGFLKIEEEKKNLKRVYMYKVVLHNNQWMERKTQQYRYEWFKIPMPCVETFINKPSNGYQYHLVSAKLLTTFIPNTFVTISLSNAEYLYEIYRLFFQDKAWYSQIEITQWRHHTSYGHAFRYESS